MAVSTHTTTISIATSDAVGSTQTISCGFNPAAIIAFATGNSSATDSLAGGAVHGSFGVAVSTTERASVAFMSTNASAAVNDGRIGRNDALLCQVLGNGSVGSLLDLSAKDSSGYTVIIDDQFTVASRVSLFAIGGDDITNTATGWLTAPTGTGDLDVTSLAFQPDFLILFACAQDSDANFTSNARSALMIGAATATGQRVTATAQGPEANADSQSKSYSYDGECIAIIADTPTTIGCRASFTQFLSNGFRLNFLEAGTAYRVGFLAIKGGQWRIDDFLSSTTLNDTIAESGFGFAPVGGMVFSHGAAKSTQDTVQSQARMSIGAFSGASQRVAQAYIVRDGQATTDNYRGIEHDSVVLRISDAGALDGLIDISSLDSGGITFIQDDADSDAAYIWYWAVGNNATGNQFTQSVSGSVAASVGAVVRRTGKSFGGSVASSGTIIRQSVKLLSGGIGASATVQSLKTFLRSVGGSIAAAGVVVRRVSKPVGGGVAGGGGLIRSIARQLTGSIAASATLQAIRLIVVVLVGGIAAGGTVVKRIGRQVAGSVTLAITRLRHMAISMTGSIGGTGSVTKQTFVVLAGAVGVVGVVRKIVHLMLIGSVSSAGTIIKRVYLRVAGVILSSGVLTSLASGVGVVIGSTKLRGAWQTAKLVMGKYINRKKLLGRYDDDNDLSGSF